MTTFSIEKMDGRGAGELWLITDDASGALAALAFAGRKIEPRLAGATPRSSPSEARKAMDRYFEGDLAALDRIKVDAVGTPFQKSVWDALRHIPVGETCSYGDIAKAIGSPGAVRAVGTANGRNPIAIVVPCHRVIGTDGGLHGYGGGLDKKAWLLAHEGAVLARAKLRPGQLELPQDVPYRRALPHDGVERSEQR